MKGENVRAEELQNKNCSKFIQLIEVKKNEKLY